jgi:outer membrane protein assembly factor BamB
MDSLHLRLVWQAHIPTAGPRDGLFSLQILENQLLVQTKSGTVAALDPVTGSTLWRTRVGIEYRVIEPLGVSATTVFAYNGVVLNALERSTGRILWTFTPTNGPSTAPAPDGSQLFLPLVGGKLNAFRFAKPPAEVLSSQAPPAAAIPPSGDKATASPPPEAKPELGWTFQSPNQFLFPPVVYGETILISDSAGRFTGMNRGSGYVQYFMQADAPLSAPMGQHGEMLYAALTDNRLVSGEITSGKIGWRFTAGGPIMQQPVVLDEDIYLLVSGTGLYRLGRLMGDQIWVQPAGDRFLAATPSVIYALGRQGQLLIIDKSRGSVLAQLDTRDFTVSLTNELTDRVFLGAHDGTLICLADRDSLAPVINKKVVPFVPEQDRPARKSPAANGKTKKEAEKEEEK